MRKIIIFSMLLAICFFINPVSASNTCKDVSLTFEATPDVSSLKVDMVGHVVGDVTKVTFTTKNSETGIVECDKNVFCPKCINKGKCVSTCSVSTPGTYDITMTAYGVDGCTVTDTKENVVIGNSIAKDAPCVSGACSTEAIEPKVTETPEVPKVPEKVTATEEATPEGVCCICKCIVICKPL